MTGTARVSSDCLVRVGVQLLLVFLCFGSSCMRNRGSAGCAAGGRWSCSVEHERTLFDERRAAGRGTDASRAARSEGSGI
uniref:Predicted protein n=1 Tax=Hordeum vulgare subsp. vulgare TaxID=112509 RepID=F2E0D7_HORVV|nr:predicted protein [Hordeum vulgare subsp. vulgare]